MKKPFVQLFRTPNAYYVLDANNNEFIQVSGEAFAYLCEVLSERKAWNAEEVQELGKWAEQGYLSTKSNVNDLSHTYTKYLKYFLDRKLSKVTLQLTQGCNFRCKYCVYSEEGKPRQRSHSEKTMSFETAKKAIDFFQEHSVDSKNVNIGFYGGEPLLEYPLLKEVVNYAKERFRGKKLTFSITTNATLLNEEIITYFQEHDFGLLISLDGPKEINDLNRVFPDGTGTFDEIIKSIELISKVSPEYAERLMINMVVDPNNDFDCYNLAEFEGERLRRSMFSSSVVENDYGDAGTVFSEDYSWKSEYQSFLAVLSHFGRFPEESVSPLAEAGVKSAVRDYSRIANGGKLRAVDLPSGPCIPGQMRLFVNVDEKLLPCERVSEKSHDMSIGTLSEGFDYQRAEKILNVAKLMDADCKNCWAFRYCTLCVKKADDGTALSKAAIQTHCQSIKAGAYDKLQLHLLLREAAVYYPGQIRDDELTGLGGEVYW